MKLTTAIKVERTNYSEHTLSELKQVIEVTKRIPEIHQSTADDCPEPLIYV